MFMLIVPRRWVSHYLVVLWTLAIAGTQAAAQSGSIFDDDYQGAEIPADVKPAPATDDPQPLRPLPEPATSDPADDAAADDDPPADDAADDPPTEKTRPPLTPPSPTRRRAPTLEKQAEADQLVREVFAVEFKNKTRQGRRQLAEMLLKRATETEDDAAGRFVMLARARDLAADTGHLPVALQAVDLLEAEYWVDGPRLRVEAVLRARAGAFSKEDYAAIGSSGLKLIDQLTQLGYYRHLGALAPSVRAAALKSGDKVLATDARRVTAEAEMIAAEFERAKQSADRLKAAPDDPAANLAVGRFLCLYRGDWKGGLPKLLKGSDATLREIAAQEVAPDPDLTSRKKLAAAWWEIAEAQKSNTFLQKKAQERACAWYGTVIDELTGLERVLAEKRIEEARANGADTTLRPEPLDGSAVEESARAG